jgi:hypothetical protein
MALELPHDATLPLEKMADIREEIGDVMIYLTEQNLIA